MKRIVLIIFICSAYLVKAQPYGNEWIDYNKTYYKFKIGANGLYRISQAALSSIGLGSTPAENFQLWRNGQEITLYTSVASGPFGVSDYIEFWGEMNDGKPDKQLYRDTATQLNDRWSLQTDTAFYFLTVNPAGGNKRFVTTTNNVAGNSLPVEPYFMHTIGNYYRDKINGGFATFVPDVYIYSSAYDKGEGWTSRDLNPSTTIVGNPWDSLSVTFNNLQVYASGPTPIFTINAAGNADHQRLIRVKINGTQVIQQPLDYFDVIKQQTTFALSTLSSGSARVDVFNTFVPTAAIPADRLVVAQFELKYPRQFDFGNQKNFSFELSANSNGNYLEITNFNYGSTAPVLYDLTNFKRYVGDISDPTKVKFALLASSTNRKMLLVSEDVTNLSAVNNFQTRNFINYSATANQGNYLIISNSILFNGANGSNPVEDFRAYRSSTVGGSYNGKIYDIDQLIDQFAFGIKKHPSSIKNFLQLAYNTYTVTPRCAFLIGKGVNYVTYRSLESNPTYQNDLERLNLVPTFGNPASDNLLTCYNGNNIPAIPVGRLSVIYPDEIAVYLKKVKDYEIAQSLASCNSIDKAWMKNVMHVVGADEPTFTALKILMTKFKGIIADTFFGANVSSFYKKSTDIEQLSGDQVQHLFEDGISIITYFGHSSASTLEFNLDDPMNYNNTGKYPVFITLGCSAGNIYGFNQARFSTKETISENFVLAPDHGSVAFLATTSSGIVQYLDVFNTENYKAISITKYGATIGEIMKEAITRSFDLLTQFDYYARVHCEQISVNGDPALKYNTFPKPDYVIEDPMVKISPQFISVADTSFKVQATIMNIGKATSKPIVIEIKRTLPGGTPQVIRRDTIAGIRYKDSISISIPINPTTDKGLNQITITVDADNVVDELCETNNSVTKDVFIYEDEARPVYPYNFAIINKQNIKLVASTANPFAPSKLYTMEMDTTEFFNSPFKITKTLTSTGGVLEFTPGITFTDSTVYYWRVSLTPTSGQPKWNNASFIYLPNSEVGFNQSHIFQHFKTTGIDMYLDSTSKQWLYYTQRHTLLARNAIFGYGSNQEGDFVVSVDNDAYIRSACVGHSLIYNVIDPYTFKPWLNVDANGNNLFRYGSGPANCQPSRKWNFEFSYMTPASRKLMMDFMDSIPVGSFVVVRSIDFDNPLSYSSTWRADTSIYGSNNSLYHKLLAVGFNDVDSINAPKSWALIYQKGVSGFQPKYSVSQGLYDKITVFSDIDVYGSQGYMVSPVFGPSKQWKQLKWTGNSMENPSGDQPVISVLGIKNNGQVDTLMMNITLGQQTVDISSINTTVYPYLKLVMHNTDSSTHTAYQLRYWRLTYVPVPEGAIAPNLTFQMKDTVEVGEPIDFRIAFKNVSEVAFDSLKVKLVVTDKNNVPHTVLVPKQKPIAVGDTLLFRTTIDTKNIAGLNTLFINFNPDFDQPEQYLFNNFAYRNFYAKPDSLSPIMDVTFDGVHILNRDVVASKPHILIKLKDEAKWMVLTDTSSLTIKVKFPDGSIKRFYFKNMDTLKFTGAGPAPAVDNTAAVDFLPYFTVDGDYELIVSGKDASNNQAGNLEYRVGFQVINKPMISNMLNYPNPFTTSTAFVFTITGSEVPQNIKIEIMTITGKIVREITKEELGPLHVGRNITEFKWDGTDQYGDKLANGIYLYRVVTNLNGKSLDKYKADGDDTDKYFNKGYGKMYLMR